MRLAPLAPDCDLPRHMIAPIGRMARTRRPRASAAGPRCIRATAAYLRVSPPDHDECDCDQGGGEGHEDTGLDELERPEPVAGLVGRERSVAKPRRACECGAYLACSRVA